MLSKRSLMAPRVLVKFMSLIRGIGVLFIALIGAGFLPLATSPSAIAQPYPNRPIKIIVPFAPGGSSDVVTRLIGHEISKSLGQPVVIEDLTGAGGNIGAAHVAKSQPDGYTLLSGSNAVYIADLLFNDPGYNPLKDLVPVFLLGSSPLVLAVNPSFPAKSVADIVKLAKEKASELSYASAGYGSINYLTAEMFNIQAGIHLLNIPYRGAPLAELDVMSGRVPILFDYMLTALSNVRSGKLRALAVTSKKRAYMMPDVPAMSELGFHDFHASLWFAFFAPAGTPTAAIDKISRAALSALKNPVVKKKIEDLGIEVVAEGAEGMKKRLLDERKRWGSVIETAGIRKN